MVYNDAYELKSIIVNFILNFVFMGSEKFRL